MLFDSSNAKTVQYSRATGLDSQRKCHVINLTVILLHPSQAMPDAIKCMRQETPIHDFMPPDPKTNERRKEKVISQSHIEMSTIEHTTILICVGLHNSFHLIIRFLIRFFSIRVVVEWLFPIRVFFSHLHPYHRNHS